MRDENFVLQLVQRVPYWLLLLYKPLYSIIRPQIVLEYDKAVFNGSLQFGTLHFFEIVLAHVFDQLRSAAIECRNFRDQKLA